MKKLVTSGLPGRYFAAFTAFWMLTAFWSASVTGQGCVMTCPPSFPPTQISVSSACMDTITYEDIGVTINGCVGDIVVDIIDNGVSIGNIITIGMAGNTYMVIISNPNSGQSCTTNIMVVDNQAPVLNCPIDVTLQCTADISLYNGLNPSDIFDCSSTQVFIDDSLISSGNCDEDIISQFLRTYMVVDTFNNASTCEQVISLQKASLEDVDFPPDLVVSCFPLPDTTPLGMGMPSVGGVPIMNGTFCNLSAIRDDLIVPICSGSYKIFRTWTVFDWCENNVFIDSTQIIEIVDLTGPVVQAPADMTVSTNALMCSASLTIPPASVSDDCSTLWTVRTQGPFGTIQSNGGFVSGLPVGVHVITFIATNDCGLEGSDVMLLTVEDLQPPVPVCHQTIAVPLNNEGYAIIPASAFNAASQDNCGPVYFKVKRMSPPVGYACANPGNPNNMFDDFIQFCCEDIANNEIMVILRVYDLPPVPGPVSDTYLAGHFNDCMAQVEVQDKLPPQITCPSHLTISCEFPFTEENLDVFGTVVTSPLDQDSICIDDPGVPGNPGLQCIGFDGLALDNCNVAITTSALINVNNCGLGSIIRTFTATDDGGLQATCQQVITIINYDPFDLGDITWPLDYTTNNVCEIDLLDPEDIPPPYSAPVLNEGPCDLVAASYEDMVFDFSNNDQACFKILRTWTVIDWCQLNTPSGGMWTHLQVIKVMNTVAPVIEPIEDVVECSFDPDCGGLTLEFEATANDDCSGPASLTWRYSIDLDDDGSFDFISNEITGSSIFFTREMPIGSHRILYTVWDHCGNITTEEQFVTIESCKGPSAKCIHGLSTDLMGMDLDGDGNIDWGMVVIQAEMFDAGSDHPCGNEVTVAFSEDPLDVTRIFDCNDLGINEIELWAIDENGLTDFCITYIDIQDNMNVCPPGQGLTGVISGNITVPGSGKLANAMVYLDGSNLPGMPSGPNGYFVFPSMPFGGQYEVRPNKEGDAKNGVTTLDLVKLQKHLLGIELFSSPYQYIAADANNSQSVTAIDIIQLRKLILGYYDTLPNNSSWRFVDDAHIFPDPNNPWIASWPETYVVNPFNTSVNDVNFDAIKIGDLNLSANLHAANNIILPRSGDECEIMYAVLPQGEKDIYKVEMEIADADRFNAIQFSFGWNQSGYELVDWNPGEKLSVDDFRMPARNEESASVAVSNVAAGENKNETILSMWFRKKSTNEGQLRLYLKPGPTDPVAYDVVDEAAIKISLIQKEIPKATVSNHPNPFKDQTTIEFVSTRAEDANITFYDLNGRSVLSRDIPIYAGENELIVHKSELQGAGIYMYEIKTASQHFTNRMIIVD